MSEKRGFTLVETVTILAILAILAAILVPALTTYVDKARQQAVVSRARAAYVATQALLSERYGEPSGFDESGGLISLDADSLRAEDSPPINLDDILALAEVPISPSQKLTVEYNDRAELTQFVWQEQQGGRTITVTRQAGGWETTVS